jgi:hypothetical protein
MRLWLPALIILISGTPALAGPGEAQDQPPPISLPLPNPDFLFGRPDWSIAVRGSWLFSRAGSDWYDFVTDQLTLDSGSFNAPGIGVDVGISVTSRLEVVGGVDFNNTTSSSEYRDFVDNNRLPITQSTELRGTNISGGLRYSLIPRGREVGRLAWVPNTVVPYVGAGGGAQWYRVQQTGDFVDYVDLSIFTDRFESSGWAPSAHVFGGADVKLHRHLYLTVEVRYVWAAGDLGAEWIDFDPIDLSGLRLGTGINVVF